VRRQTVEQGAGFGCGRRQVGRNEGPLHAHDQVVMDEFPARGSEHFTNLAAQAVAINSAGHVLATDHPAYTALRCGGRHHVLKVASFEAPAVPEQGVE
jgi:hypothetical protein